MSNDIWYECCLAECRVPTYREENGCYGCPYLKKREMCLNVGNLFELSNETKGVSASINTFTRIRKFIINIFRSHI